MKTQAKRHSKLKQISVAALILCAASAHAFGQNQGDKLGNTKQIMRQLEQQGTTQKPSGSILSNPFGRVQARQQQAGEGQTWLKQFEITSVNKTGDNIEVRAKDGKNPQLFLRLSGNQNKLQGRITDFKKRQVFELSTDANGELRRIQVPATKYFADMSDEWHKARQKRKQVQALKNSKLVAGERIQKRLDADGSYITSELAIDQAPHIRPYRAGVDLKKLQSKPGSTNVVFLDQTEILNADGTVKVVLSDNGEDLDSADFKAIELNVGATDVYRVWQIVASQYSMFDLNITTDPDIYNAAATARKLKMRYKNGECDGSWQYYGSFGQPYSDDNGVTCMDSDYNDHWALGVGLTIVHELGHAFRLGHDGNATREYFTGINNVQWVPIMGNYWTAWSNNWRNPLAQFSQAEYTGAVTKDLGMTDPNAGLGWDYKGQTTSDDIAEIALQGPARLPNSNQKLLQIDAGEIKPDRNFGQVVSRTDKPKFTFNVAAPSNLSLDVEPIEVFGALDVNLRVLDAAGNLVAGGSSNRAADRRASLTNLALPTGNYSIEISGGSEINPESGFSNYGSLGYFAMKGSLVAAAAANNTKTFGPVNGAKGTWTDYSIDVPSNKKLTVTTTATTGDPDLYVRKSFRPDLTNYNCRSQTDGAAEKCSTTNTSLSTRTYHIGIYHYTATTGVKATAVISD